jgi:transcriptional regulator with XRE-family HTH domain
LKKWCDQARGRQTEVAKVLGLTRQAVNRWFSGKQHPTAEQILLVQTFLKSPRLYTTPKPEKRKKYKKKRKKYKIKDKHAASVKSPTPVATVSALLRVRNCQHEARSPRRPPRRGLCPGLSSYHLIPAHKDVIAMAPLSSGSAILTSLPGLVRCATEQE